MQPSPDSLDAATAGAASASASPASSSPLRLQSSLSLPALGPAPAADGSGAASGPGLLSWKLPAAAMGNGRRGSLSAPVHRGTPRFSTNAGATEFSSPNALAPLLTTLEEEEEAGASG